MSEQPINETGEPDGSPFPPPGSPERADQQRIGEALLTDDGRITDTPQAKTAGIQALAGRMRSSTPALILASMGLVVGNDMAAHLGDSRYVLVPHQERYPSMGADVLHVDELDPADPRHTPNRAVRMDTEQAETLIRMIAVSELMGAWAYGSNNNVRVLALQQAAQEEFGLSGTLEWQVDAKTRFAVGLELDYNRDALRDFLRTQYQMTQEVLAARGITELLAYRALSWPEEAEQPQWAAARNIGVTVEARQRPLASWSADRQIVADWLEQRRGNGVILATRQPAREILSLPTTGMGYLGQKEWVALPGDHQATLDGMVSHTSPTAAVQQTAASAVSLGAPALSDAADGPPPAPIVGAETDKRWRPLPISQALDPADPLDSRIIRILDGTEAAPRWWPRDDSDYAIARRDLDFLGISPVQIKWMLTGEAPMGMTPELYQQFGTEMLAALQLDGIEPSQVDIRLKGTGAGFFSGIHKTLPREADLTGNPSAVQRLQEWFGDDQHRPLRRPYDAMWRLGLEQEPSDFDLDINSTAIIRAARDHWRAHHTDRYPGDFMGGHGYLDKKTVASTLPSLAAWAGTWETKLGRPLSLGVFESAGPFDATRLGRALSSHFKDTDWIIHRPDSPMAWRTPRSRISEPARSPAPGRPSAAAARSKSTTARRRPDHDRPAAPGIEQPPHLRRDPGLERDHGRGPRA
ncbi:hypothetical protein SAM23877_6506 [Streptomyces ambofaciens ATCC 23877]|uniref:Uncharacterized protein n=1 Tax=Streptomyces ambofaciens (strain ATCC 23877 / 3486 / DSM 40053 / JCM 4204 / NBRC 12836 / NRRL B-2516) TaxID=278992 RepID=A0AE66_STRA7|nr:hypothetical protein [Streptomyces ambofaciens]AKZ59551.1 hypothetical protein SAM23877_6506 [Streptomyces ambofaciens ATCC 23877]CAJ88775.1 hypothetical protein SAMR1066 [Streptomyces ambofaciens ATCC 23877]